jgi:hypothetical protein
VVWHNNDEISCFWYGVHIVNPNPFIQEKIIQKFFLRAGSFHFCLQLASNSQATIVCAKIEF